jgi:hypothetical protein
MALHISLNITSEIRKQIKSICNKEQLHDQWKESITVPIYGRTVELYSNYRGISQLSASYNILRNTLLSRLSIHIVEIIEAYQRGFRRNRPNTEQ